MKQLFTHLMEAGIKCRKVSNSVVRAGSCLRNSGRLLSKERRFAEETDKGK
jgi:hypothetical protein